MENNSDLIYAPINVSEKVKRVALRIVGNSTDVEAAKKLAEWVGKYIEHEKGVGFYQTPDETLTRKIGNCCCHADLFLQMCVAVGLNETHKLYYVHVGTMEFGKRHFFAMFDDVFVDADSYRYNPWGHGSFRNRYLNTITEYPFLPLIRTYEI